MENINSQSTVQCPKCKSQEVNSTISIIDKNTGLKTGNTAIIWGLIMMVAGAFFIGLGIINWNLPEARPGLIIGVGVLLLLNGIRKTITFLLRKKESYFYYHCSNCSYKWNRLGGEGNLQAIKEFVDALESDDIGKKENALKVILNIQDTRFLESIRKNLSHKNSEIRSWAYSVLFGFKEEVTLDEISTAIQDEEKEIRALAAKALGGHKNDSAIDQLIHMLEDKSTSVRAEALLSLRKVTGKKLANETSWQAWWEEKKLNMKV